MIKLSQQGSDVLVAVKVVPKASRDRIAGELDGALKVTVSAPPERGAANAAVCKLLAAHLGIRRAQVSVESGHGSPHKILRIRGLPLAAVEEALSSEA